MTTRKKVEIQTPEQSTEFVHLPKQVHKEAIIQLFGYATIYYRLQNFIGADVATGCFSTPVSTALELMGFGVYQVTDSFVDNVYSIVAYYSNKYDMDLTSSNTELLGKKIYKAVLVEVSKVNRKKQSHE